MEEEKKTEDRRLPQNRVRRQFNPLYKEIFMLLFLGFSVLLTFCLYSDTFGDSLGDYLRALMLGLFGIGAMLLPPIMAYYAFDKLFIRHKRRQASRIFWGVCAFLCLISLVHAVYKDNGLPASAVTASGNASQSYFDSGSIYNGGVIGGVLGDVFYNSMGRAGTILTLFVALISACVLFSGHSLSAAIRTVTGYAYNIFAAIISSLFSESAERVEYRQPEYRVKAGNKRYKLKKAAAPAPVKTIVKPMPPKPAVVQRKKQRWKIPVIGSQKKKNEGILLAFEDFRRKQPVKARQGMQARTVSMRPAVNDAITVRGLVEDDKNIRIHPAAEKAGLQEGSKESDKPASWIDDLLLAQANARPYNDLDMNRAGSEPKVYGRVIDGETPDEDDVLDEIIDPGPDQDDSVFGAPEKQREIFADSAHPIRSMSIPEGVDDADNYKDYRLPPIEFLNRNPGSAATESKAQILENSYKLEETLRSFRVEAKVVEVSVGPTVTRYELAPGQGVKVSQIASLSNDLALSLAASGIRIEAPIPGKSAVGIEIPNKEMQPVYLREIIEDEAFKRFSSKLAFGVGKDITGNTIVADISKMPHLLIAGATGSGKSVCINTLIASILYKAKPNEVKLLMVDPKVVELSVYNGIPHLLAPVVTDCKKASAALNWAVAEMDIRYNLFAEANVRDLKSYNAVKAERAETDVLPQIVIIIDELADLMMAAKGEIEELICRLAQKARAAGLHLIIATQRPSVDVITGLIKANIPSRLAFAVSSGTDSRTVLDMTGAEKLLGKGDMLFLPVGLNKPIRIQCGFITDREVEDIVEYLSNQNPVRINQEMSERVTDASRGGESAGDLDQFYNEAVEFLVSKGKGSASMLQRQFRIGYNRASRLIEELESRGIVGPEDGSKPRKVLITMEQWRNSQ